MTNMDQKWPQYGTLFHQKLYLPLKCPLDPVEMVLKLQNQASIEVKLSQPGPNMAQTWSWHIPKASTLYGHVPYSQITQSSKYQSFC